MNRYSSKRSIAIVATVVLALASLAGGAYAELKDNNNGTITDTTTGLVWLKNANCFGPRSWYSAVNSAAPGLSSGACGLSDGSKPGQWRLPTLNQLRARAATRTGFSNVQSSGSYWSSETFAQNTSHAWLVYMGNNYPYQNDKNGYIYVWPVRGGQ